MFAEKPSLTFLFLPPFIVSYPACKELSTREKQVIKEPGDGLYPERRRRVADLIRPRFKGC
ncbi:hypothetical protein U9M48_013589 [Paspalum notatum var. saurae]|uniref:Uncharacterized protein n=1 Tax=Paspalum notatum var. saurae TaxID=547442 RepID=A0AAQ3WJP6_PASNO